ncbi:hypothetical protein DdX_07503 [Ditylenchus destructor]|uniref:Uncharacterized protein n=1 Tax=Ditylenchus destructor TaxID=166010 RepID=A0AAD4R8F5_9BILA|nr:hypothetical protein DdX_07503 [Ditylenchus destructor]
MVHHSSPFPPLNGGSTTGDSVGAAIAGGSEGHCPLHVHFLCEGKHLPGSPIHLTVTSSPLPTTSNLPQTQLKMDSIDNVSFSGLHRPCAIGSLVEAVINARGDAKPITEDITVFTLSPQRRNRENCHLAYRPSTNSYAATFVPSEVGEWQMHILHKGRHIKGSPFQCQVFDPNLVSVYGLDVGLVGQELRFTVDTSLAGEGTLKVSVIRQGRQIPSYITEEKAGIYKVSFTPDGSGQYKIHITFNQLEVKGSPFLLDIADASSVSVHGDNLRMAAVGKLATFFIHAVSAESKDITVIVTGPSNKQKHAIIIPVDATTYRAEWRPNVIGEHHISVLLFEQHVAESPFTCSVGDPERVTVKIPSYLDTRKLGTVHSFEIDATLAGSGNLEIIINGGRVACRVRELSPRHFKAEFTPTQKLKHVIEMRFNGYDVVNSPWILQVRDSDCEAEGTHQPKTAKYFHEQYSELVGSGLHQAAVGQLTSFEVRSDSLREENIKARLSGENVMVVPVSIRQKYKSLLCEYKVPKVGDYKLEIFINGQIIDSGPLSVSAYDPSNVFIRLEAEDYSVGKSVQFVEPERRELGRFWGMSTFHSSMIAFREKTRTLSLSSSRLAAAVFCNFHAITFDYHSDQGRGVWR